MFKKTLAFVAASLAGVSAFAAGTSILDAPSKAAITAGYSDMQATALDVVTTSWPFLLGVLAIMFAPKIVKRIASSL